VRICGARTLACRVATHGDAWVFKDTRMPVATVFENLEAGLTVEEVMEEFSVTREQIPCGQISAVLHFAAETLQLA
jgi:uncharacterized protein (DUF433 family)